MYHKWVIKEEYSTNDTPILLNKWWDVDHYIDVGRIDSPEYLTIIPKEGNYYVTVDKLTGAIDYIYEFDTDNNVWIKYTPKININGTIGKEFEEFIVTVKPDDDSHIEEDSIKIEVKSPNIYSKSTDKITKKEFSNELTATLSVTPADGYTVTKWQKNDVDIEDSNKNSIVDYIDEDVNYTVILEAV